MLDAKLVVSARILVVFQILATRLFRMAMESMLWHYVWGLMLSWYEMAIENWPR